MLKLENKTILITGIAGFIGSHLAKCLLRTAKGTRIIGIDNLNSYYDVRLKENRLNELYALSADAEFVFVRGSIADGDTVSDVFRRYRPQIVVNLAAQAGVRHSITHPAEYMEANVTGFFHILEACRSRDPDGIGAVEHLIFASSSSVYGNTCRIPYSVDEKTDEPVSFYAATKKADELMAYAYSSLYGIPMTGLRFFTVYGPAGRPDMAYFRFAEQMRGGEPIRLFNYGECRRDFTFVDDIVSGIVRVMQKAPEENRGGARYKLYNIGNGHPVRMLDFVDILQQELVRADVLPRDYRAGDHMEMLPMQPGDVEETCADVSGLLHDFGFRPQTTLREGLRRFALWYRDYCADRESGNGRIRASGYGSSTETGDRSDREFGSGDDANAGNRSDQESESSNNTGFGGDSHG